MLRRRVVGVEARGDHVGRAEHLAELAAAVLQRARAFAAQALEQREVAVEQVVAAALARQRGNGDVGLSKGHGAIQPGRERRVKRVHPEGGRIGSFRG